MRNVLALFAFLILLSTSIADSTWSWNTYGGTVQWQVTVTDSGCGEPYSNDYTIPIDFNQGTATMGDTGHGPVTGTFLSPNILHINGRTVDDPPGTSVLSAYDVYFTTDCTSFAATYTWDYSDSSGSCSGSTRLAGTNSAGCPTPKNGCNSDSDCSAGQVCTNGECVTAPPNSCQTSFDCNSTSHCENGVCVSNPTQNVCRSDSDCNTGHVCQNGVCVTGSQPQPPPTPLPEQLATARQKLDTDLLLRQGVDRMTKELEDSYGCPPGSPCYAYAKTVQENLPSQIKAELDQVDKAEADLEARYLAILAQDPNNLQANLDMAELKKSQANYDDYRAYMAKAIAAMTDNSQVDQAIEDMQATLGFHNMPTPDTSKVVQQLGTEKKELGVVFGIDISKLSKEERDQAALNLIILSVFDHNGDILNSQTVHFK